MMNAPAVRVSEEGVVSKQATRYLSHSRVSKYLHCPEQYRLYYVEHLRPRFPAASLVFGAICAVMPNFSIISALSSASALRETMATSGRPLG